MIRQPATQKAATDIPTGRPRKWSSALGLGLALAVAGCDGGLFKSHAPPPVVDTSAAKVADDYIIGSGDQLSIFVYRNPDLSEAAWRCGPTAGSRPR